MASPQQVTPDAEGPKKRARRLLFGYGSLDVGQIEEGVRRFASYVK